MDHTVRAPARGVTPVAGWVAVALAASLSSACGGGSETPAAPGYSQADVAGTWDFVVFLTSTAPGWERRTATVDGTGAATITSFEDEQGSASGPTGLALKVDPAGAVTETALGVPTAFHGFLARDRKLLAGVSTPSPATYSIAVGRKRDGTVTWSNADIRNRSFALHSLRDGPEGWRHGNGTIDADGLVSIASAIGPSLTSLPAPPPDGATLSVDSHGFVTDGAAFRGFLATDKNTIFAVHTDPSGGTYALTVIQFTGGTFAQPELGGTWGYSSLGSNWMPIWLTGKLAIAPAGLGTYLSYLDSTGSTALPGQSTFLLDPHGAITISTNPSYRGTLALGGDMYVRTQTHSLPGRYGIGVALRR